MGDRFNSETGMALPRRTPEGGLGVARKGLVDEALGQDIIVSTGHDFCVTDFVRWVRERVLGWSLTLLHT